QEGRGAAGQLFAVDNEGCLVVSHPATGAAGEQQGRRTSAGRGGHGTHCAVCDSGLAAPEPGAARLTTHINGYIQVETQIQTEANGNMYAEERHQLIVER